MDAVAGKAGGGTKMTAREKLIDLLKKAKSSMLGQSGLSCELARNSYIAEYLLANGVSLETKQATSDKTSDENKRFATDNSVGDKGSPTEPLTNGHRWIPVTERLPEIGCNVLVIDSVTGEVTTAHLNDFNGFVFRDGRGHGASHWMPLPERRRRASE